MQPHLLILTIFLFFFINIAFADKQVLARGDGPSSSKSQNIPVSVDSAAIAAQKGAINAPHANDKDNIPADSDDDNPIAGHVLGNNGDCPDRPDDCDRCRGWSTSSQCGSTRKCGKGYTCCETYCCYRQCTIPRDEYRNAYEDDV